MPIDTKTLGKYRLPKIYQVEIDQSIVELPIQDVLINLVPGFSKKGPVNRPVRVDSPAEFESIFGTIDKNLENKGSFFHRMVEDMLNTGPVLALNLLKTDPIRDTLEYESFSVSAQYDNGSKITAPYERFFNRQDFWERDTESFGDIVIGNNIDNPTTQPDPTQNLLSITNIGTTRLTTFIYKSSVTGFDIPAEQWYGSVDKVPLFMNPRDLISDYMITVLAVAGDFTDYNALSVDTYWGKYFNVNGLIKSQLTSFINDDFINKVAYYDCSLIPNFRDLNDLDMYVKDVINSQTDTTGLFCWYNEDALLSEDFYKGNIDLIGQTLVNSTKTTLNFLSYQGSISEALTYNQKSLDDLGNVLGNYAQRNMSVGYYTATGRTAQYTNWYTNVSPSGISATYTNNISSIDGVGVITLTGTSITTAQDDIIYFNKSFGTILYTTPYYVTSVGSGTITISETKGGNTIIPVSGSTTNIFVYSLKQQFKDDYDSFSYIIGQTLFSGSTALQETLLFHEPLTIGNSGISYSRYDVVYLSSDYTKLHILKGNQITGTSPTKPNYLLNNESTIILGYVKIQYTGVVGSAEPSITYAWQDGGVTVDTDGYKYYGTSVNLNYYVTGTSGVTSGKNYLDLTFVGTKGSVDYTNYKQLRMKKIFTELYTNLLLNKSVMISQLTGIKTPVLNPVVYAPTVTSDGHIMIYFDTTVAPFEYFNTSNSSFLFYYIDNEFVLDTINSINTLQTLYTPLSNISPFVGIVAKWSNLYQDFYNGIINNGDYFFIDNVSGTTETKIFLKMYTDADGILTIKFVDETGTLFNISQWLTNYGSKLTIYSNRGDLKETVEIENPTYITDVTNTTSIYVDKTRYSSLVRGMYLEAYYDTTYYDDPTGEGYILGMIPRKLVRITDIKNDTVNPAYKILYTDGPIRVNTTGVVDEYYTTSYKTIDNYFNEYVGITMKPFVIHADSIPNGTDARQQEILSVVDKSTNLAKGLSNKNRVSWRYMIDSFGLGLTANSKQELVDLCGMKLNCLGFINMPSVRQLKTSINPSFINIDRTLNTEYLAEGGNPDTNPSFLYSFAKKNIDVDGRSCVGYFFPYVKGSDDLTKFVPPAAKAAKAYMNKFLTTTGGIYPWTIVAGSILGSLPDVKETEMGFTDDNLTDLMNMGANPLDYTQKRGYYINSENTAQVFPYSSLSVIHTREVLIELENRMYDMLLNYQWRFNTNEIRNEIKYRADQICKELWDAGALYNFKNVMDKSNNTNQIIDLQMGVLDTYIEVIKGMGTIVNNITILKKGSIQSGGFVPSNKSI